MWRADHRPHLLAHARISLLPHSSLSYSDDCAGPKSRQIFGPHEHARKSTKQIHRCKQKQSRGKYLEQTRRLDRTRTERKARRSPVRALLPQHTRSRFCRSTLRFCRPTEVHDANGGGKGKAPRPCATRSLPHNPFVDAPSRREPRAGCDEPPLLPPPRASRGASATVGGKFDGTCTHARARVAKKCAIVTRA